MNRQTVDKVRRNLVFGAPALAIGTSVVSRQAFAQLSAVDGPNERCDSAQINAAAAARDAAVDADHPGGRLSSEMFCQVKERLLDQTIEITRAALDWDSVCEALAWQSEFPQSALFRAIETPILPAHLDGTKYDCSDLRRRYPAQFGRHRHVASPRIIASIDKDRDPLFKKEGYLPDNYGNCFYWNTADVIVTAEHLAETFPDSLSSLRKDGFDISIATVPAHSASRSAEQIVYDDPSVSDADIHGSLVCIVGKDPDAFGDMDGVKTFPGIAVKMTPEFIRGILSEIPQANRRGMTAHEYERFIRRMQSRMNNSYMIVLPQGEAREYPHSDGEVPCQGMSASPVFGFIRGKYRPVGMFFSAMCLEDAERRRTVDVAFFHPISAIRKLAGQPEAYWTFR
jgi:hypothetical protein